MRGYQKFLKSHHPSCKGSIEKHRSIFKILVTSDNWRLTECSDLLDLRSRMPSYSAVDYSSKQFATTSSHRASSSLWKRFARSRQLAVCRLLNNITFNLPRLVDVMIASSDNLLLIILGRSLAYVYVRQALTTKLTTNWNIARAHNQRKNYLTVVMSESVQEYLNFPFLVSCLPYSLFHRSIRHRRLHRCRIDPTRELYYTAIRLSGRSSPRQIASY